MGQQNNKLNKVYWFKKNQNPVCRFIYLQKIVIILENLGKQKPF